jgi:hypothetical protein
MTDSLLLYIIVTFQTRSTQRGGVPLRPTVNNVGAPTYQLLKYVAGLLSQLTEKLKHHVRNSFQFAQTMDSLTHSLPAI